MKKIALICPEEMEYKKAIEVLDLEQKYNLGNREAHLAEFEKYSLYAIHSGPGKVHAASAAQQIIEQIKPDLLIDSGIGSALLEKINLFSIISGVNIYEFDLYSTEEIEEIPPEILSKTLIDNNNKREVLNELFANKLRHEVITADLVSGEKRVDNRIFRELLHMKFKAEGVGRESSAIIKTAELNNVDSLSLRVITDYADKNWQEDREKNKDEGLTILYSTLKDLIKEDFYE